MPGIAFYWRQKTSVTAHPDCSLCQQSVEIDRFERMDCKAAMRRTHHLTANGKTAMPDLNAIAQGTC